MKTVAIVMLVLGVAMAVQGSQARKLLDEKKYPYGYRYYGKDYYGSHYADAGADANVYDKNAITFTKTYTKTDPYRYSKSGSLSAGATKFPKFPKGSKDTKKFPKVFEPFAFAAGKASAYGDYTHSNTHTNAELGHPYDYGYDYSAYASSHSSSSSCSGGKKNCKDYY